MGAVAEGEPLRAAASRCGGRASRRRRGSAGRRRRGGRPRPCARCGVRAVAPRRPPAARTARRSGPRRSVRHARRRGPRADAAHGRRRARGPRSSRASRPRGRRRRSAQGAGPRRGRRDRLGRRAAGRARRVRHQSDHRPCAVRIDRPRCARRGARRHELAQRLEAVGRHEAASDEVPEGLGEVGAREVGLDRQVVEEERASALQRVERRRRRDRRRRLGRGGPRTASSSHPSSRAHGEGDRRRARRGAQAGVVVRRGESRPHDDLARPGRARRATRSGSRRRAARARPAPSDAAATSKPWSIPTASQQARPSTRSNAPAEVMALEEVAQVVLRADGLDLGPQAVERVRGGSARAGAGRTSLRATLPGVNRPRRTNPLALRAPRRRSPRRRASSPSRAASSSTMKGPSTSA